LPYKDATKAREAKRLSAAKRRANATDAERDAEREANAAQMARAKAEAPPTERIVNPDGLTGIQPVGDLKSGDIAASDEKSFGRRGSSNGRRRGTLVPLADKVLGKGWDYVPGSGAMVPGWWDGAMPSWWKGVCPYKGEERRWVLYSLGRLISINPDPVPVVMTTGRVVFHREPWTWDQGQAAELRGVEIWAMVANESRDVQWVAAWHRDLFRNVPSRARGFTAARLMTANRRLKALGLLRREGAGPDFRIR
jgi:hypothetical protein